MSSKLIFASTAAAVAATSAGAVMVFSIGVDSTIVAFAALAGVSAYFVHRSRLDGAASVPAALRPAEHPGFIASIRDGLKLATRDRVVLTLIAGMATYGISLGSNNFALPLFALNDLCLHRQLYGFLESMFALGGLVGALLAKHIIKRAGERVCFCCGLLLLGLTYVGYSINRSSLIAFALMIVAGIVFTIVLVAQGPMILKAAPAGYTGRFWALLSPIQSTFALLSTLAVSATAAMPSGQDVGYSAYAASVFIGAIMLRIGGTALLVGAMLRKQRNKDPAPNRWSRPLALGTRVSNTGAGICVRQLFSHNHAGSNKDSDRSPLPRIHTEVRGQPTLRAQRAGYSSAVFGALRRKMGTLIQNMGDMVLQLNFTAVDVETANDDRGSVCAVGMTLVRDGRIVRTVEWHVKPHADVPHFNKRNIAIHKITPEIAGSGSSWEESLEAIKALAGNYPLVAYNAPFDSSAIQRASNLAGLPGPSNNFLCALTLSRRLLTLPAYKLPTVAAALGVAPFDHHSPRADADACAQVVLALAERENVTDVANLWSPTPTTSAAANTPDHWSKNKTARISELPQPNVDAPTGHILYGKQVIFTGELQSMDRWDAMERVALHGGINGKGITKKTRFLVIGGVSSVDAGDLADGTTKERKAWAYIEGGQDIRVLTEQHFVVLCDSAEPTGLEMARPIPHVAESEKGTSAVFDPTPPQQAPSATGSVAPQRSIAPQDSPRISQPTPAPSVGFSEPEIPASARDTDSSKFAGFVLWLGGILGVLSTLLFVAVGISLFVEGSAAAGSIGLVMAVFIGTLGLICFTRLGRRRRKRVG